MSVRRSFVLLLLAAGTVAVGCSEPECPDGFDKVGNSCRRADAGARNDGSIDPVEEAPRDAGADAGSAAPGWTGSGDAVVGAPQDGSTGTGAGDRLDGSLASDVSPPPVTPEASVVSDASSGSAADGASDALPPDSTVPVDVCIPNPCQHGGTCSVAANAAVCNCEASGHTGSRCETDIDECAQANVCSHPAYPCVQTEPPGYTCQGHFADWPMPDSSTFGGIATPNYDYSTDLTVTSDKVTGLDWQREPPSTYPLCSGMKATNRDSCTWDEAENYCERLVLGGKSDWRLPTKIELESILDFRQGAPHRLDASAFPSVRSEVASYWTSSSEGDLDWKKWIASTSGITLTALNTATHLVRCVRTRVRPASGTPQTRYTKSDTTVRDNRTGLLWQSTPEATLVGRAEAADRCARLGAGWRLPSVKELLTLVDPTSVPPIDPTAFPATPVHAAMSSNTDGENGFLGVTFGPHIYAAGGSFAFETSQRMTVRCVRGR